MDKGTIVERVEYETAGSGASASVSDYEYLGVIERPSDLVLCLALRKLGASRRMFVETGLVRAITLNGVRHQLEVSVHRPIVRGQEIVRIIEGNFSESWADQYFDENSPKFHKKPRKILQQDTSEVNLTLKLDSVRIRRAQIIYHGNGGETERVIVPNSIDGVLTIDPHRFTIDAVNARCEMRGGERTFILARIGEVMDIETGELMDKVAWATSLPIQKEALQEATKIRVGQAEQFNQRDAAMGPSLAQVRESRAHAAQISQTDGRGRKAIVIVLMAVAIGAAALRVIVHWIS